MTQQEAQTQLAAIVEKINSCQKKALDSYIEIGAELYDLKNSSLYLYVKNKDGANYESVYDLIKDYFAMSKSTVNYHVNVFKRFADENSHLIKPLYKDYSFSQLREMLFLTDSAITLCKPSMTCEEIRELGHKPKAKVKKETDDFVPDPNNSLKIDMPEELYNKVLSRANRRKKHMADLVIEILELYFAGLQNN